MSDLYLVASLVAGVLAAFAFYRALKYMAERKKLDRQNQDRKDELNREPVGIKLERLKEEIESTEHKIENGQKVFAKLEDELKKTLEKLEPIDVGMSPPTFAHDDSEKLKAKVKTCLTEQLKLIREGGASTCYTNWTWEGSISKAQVMINDYKFLTLNAFNAEFDVIRKQMRHSTFDVASRKLTRLREQLESLGETAGIKITREYYNLKLGELKIWHNELVHKENLKQERKKQRALLKSQGASQSFDVEDIEDELFYKKADLNKARLIAKEKNDSTLAKVELEIQKLKDEIAALEKKQERAISQAQITRAGYIYVISNVGCFGEGIVKIGMTRRLEPMDRVTELGDASVAFKFDVHTLAFVDNAPSIEKALHRKFNEQRVNIENHRKEFFKVSPQEVQVAMIKMGIESDWYFDIEAKEYRESLLMREVLKSKSIEIPSIVEALPSQI